MPAPLVAWHPVDPAVLAVNVFQGPIQIFNLPANSTLEIAGRENVRKLAWSPDGTRLASVGDSEELIQTESALEIWDPATGAMVTAYTDGYIFTDCAWNPANNGQILLAGLMMQIWVTAC